MINNLFKNINARRAAMAILVIVILYLLAYLGCYLYFRYSKPAITTDGDNNKNNNKNNGGTSASTGSSTSAAVQGYPLRWGSRGDSVRGLQQVCLARGISVGITGADGIWGRNTENAVRQLKVLEYQYTDTAGRGAYRPYDAYIKPLSVQPSASGSQLEIRTPEDLNSILNQ